MLTINHKLKLFQILKKISSLEKDNEILKKTITLLAKKE